MKVISLKKSRLQLDGFWVALTTLSFVLINLAVSPEIT